MNNSNSATLEIASTSTIIETAPKVQARTVTGITEFDQGVVGYADIMGKTPYGYTNQNEGVSMEQVNNIANYPVALMPLSFEANGITYQTQDSSIFRTDTNQLLYPSVGAGYTIVSNEELTAQVEGLLKQYSNLHVESCGTLNGGQTFFISVLVHKGHIKGDVSPTCTRLFMSNAFGGQSLASCLNTIRTECMNTYRMAMSQGKVNKTLARFRHTKNASRNLANHVIDLADLIGEVRTNEEQMNYLAGVNVNTQYITDTLEALFPQNDLDAGRSKSIAVNKQAKVLELFDTKEDLKPLADTRYKLFQAITDYTSNHISMTGEENFGKRMVNSLAGSADKLNQKAFEIIMA
jgi:phage/plasmid-like protein (TIGR03299 family)